MPSLMDESKFVLLALRPNFAEAIYGRTKRFEFRRTRVSIVSSDIILVYETAPISSITGSFVVGRVVQGKPEVIVTLEPDQANRKAVEQYLAGAKVASAIEVTQVTRWHRSVPLSEILPGTKPPQSYIFPRSSDYGILRNCETSRATF